MLWKYNLAAVFRFQVLSDYLYFFCDVHKKLHKVIIEVHIKFRTVHWWDGSQRIIFYFNSFAQCLNLFSPSGILWYGYEKLKAYQMKRDGNIDESPTFKQSVLAGGIAGSVSRPPSHPHTSQVEKKEEGKNSIFWPKIKVFISNIEITC